MREVVQVASKSVIVVDHKTNEIVVTNKLVEVIVGTPSEPQAIPGGLKVDFVTLSDEDISNGKAYITSTKLGGILLDVIGGCPQYEGFDFIVGEDFVEWRGLGLEELLEVGDMLRLAYIERG